MLVGIVRTTEAYSFSHDVRRNVWALEPVAMDSMLKLLRTIQDIMQS